MKSAVRLFQAHLEWNHPRFDATWPKRCRPYNFTSCANGAGLTMPGPSSCSCTACRHAYACESVRAYVRARISGFHKLSLGCVTQEKVGGLTALQDSRVSAMTYTKR